eukprot:587935-Rhodomonas_salina.3
MVLSGTGIRYQPTHCAMCGTELPDDAIGLRLCYAMSGTDLAYRTTSYTWRFSTQRLQRIALSYRPTHLLCDVRYWHGVRVP